MHVLKSLILIIFLISLSGCSLFGPRKIEVRVEEIPRAAIALPLVDKFHYDPMPWYIVTEKNAADVFAKLKADGYDPIIFGLTDKGYENASLNQARMLKLMLQLDATIRALNAYYLDPEETETKDD